MFNLPPNIFNSPYLQNMVGQAKKPGWSEVNPFRTVADNRNGFSAGAYGKGLNHSAAQLYDHFRPNGKWEAWKAGLPKAGQTQSFDSFDQRLGPQPAQPMQPPQINVPPPVDPVAPVGLPNFNFGGFSPANGIFNIQPNPGIAVTPAPVGGTGGQSGFDQYKATGQLPNFGGIFNMPQLNRR